MFSRAYTGQAGVSRPVEHVEVRRRVAGAEPRRPRAVVPDERPDRVVRVDPVPYRAVRCLAVGQRQAVPGASEVVSGVGEVRLPPVALLCAATRQSRPASTSALEASIQPYI